MRSKTFFMCAFLFLFFATCAKEFTEDTMKSDIKAWWGAKQISDILIDDYLEEDTLVTVLSRLVVAGDTTVRMSYEYKKFKKGWKLTKGPFDERTKEFCIQEMSESLFKNAREAVIKASMRNVQSVLEIIYVEKGGYPSSIVTGDSIMGEDILRYFQRAKNPYFSDEPAFIDALGDTGEWFPEYIGKVIYFAWVEEDETVSHFLVRGSTSMEFIDLVMGMWGEEY